MANRWAILTTGNHNWSSTATWSSTADGLTTPVTAPGSGDNVYISAICQAGATLTDDVGGGASCLSFDMTGGAANPPTFAGSNDLYVYGTTFTLVAGMTWTCTGNLGLAWGSNNCAVTLAGVVLTSDLYFGQGTVNVTTFLDNPNVGTHLFQCYRGVDLTNRTLTCGYFNSNFSSTRTLTLTGATINCSRWNFTTTTGPLTFYPPLVLNVSGTSNFATGGLNYNAVTLAGATVTVTGSGIYNTSFSLTPSVTQTITFTDLTTQTAALFNLAGTAGHVHTLKGSSTAGWSLAKIGDGVINADYLSISYSTATPLGYAGANSTDGGHNTGWLFTFSPPITLKIGTTTITTLEESSFRIDSILGQTVDTAKLTIYDKNANIAIPEQVDIVITRTDTGERIFGGLSSMPTGWTEGLSRWWDLQCQDYTILLDTNIVMNSFPAGFTYDGLSGDQAIIAHLFEHDVVSLGVSVPSEIEARTYVGSALASMAAMYFNYTTLREALQTIAGYTGWNYQVDYNKHLHYYYREDVAAPYALSSSPDGSTSIGYHGLKWKRDGTSVRNLYLMFGSSLFSSVQTYYLAGDASKTKITLGIADLGQNVLLEPPPGETNILVWINTGTFGTPVWTAKTVGLDGIDTTATKDCIFNSTQQWLQFAVAPPNLANAVKVQAVYVLSAGQGDTENASINKYGRTFGRRLVAADSNSAAALNAKLQSYKTQFAYALETCTLSVDTASFPGTTRFAVGQWVYLTNAILGIVNKGFLIHRITTTIKGGTLMGYELELRNWFTDVAA